eukprot:Ihof_evm18s18 gene=Ihof_evmTU18s18
MTNIASQVALDSTSTHSWRELAEKFSIPDSTGEKCHLCQLKERTKREGEERRRNTVKKVSLRGRDRGDPEEEDTNDTGKAKPLNDVYQGVQDILGKIISPLIDTSSSENDPGNQMADASVNESDPESGIYLLKACDNVIDLNYVPELPKRPEPEYTDGEMDERKRRFSAAVVNAEAIVQEAEEVTKAALTRFISPSEK